MIESRDGTTYDPGLSRVHEMVISSHFMHKISQNQALNLYDDHSFEARRIAVSIETVVGELFPLMKSAAEEFCLQRASAAFRRASEKHHQFGLATAGQVGAPEIITEALFDKEFSRNGERYNSRQALSDRIRQMIMASGCVEMVMPALPFKIPSPLKSRGRSPDMGEINFLLNVYEVCRTVELIWQTHGVKEQPLRVQFTIISDGSRFEEIVNESSCTLTEYQRKLSNWIDALGFQKYVSLVDYRELLAARLPEQTRGKKAALFSLAHQQYSDTLWPVFDPCNVADAFIAATQLELDPEFGNSEGRFVSLFKSLIYTVRYKCLDALDVESADETSRIYRELTAHLFVPYLTGELSATEFWTSEHEGSSRDLTLHARENLRRAMLAEAWAAAISYIAEIKSDRDLDEDPILACFPNCLRWTIHPKPGQLAISAPPILGMSVQPWAGSAVFRRRGKRGIRLCTLPSVVLEAMHAVPVMLESLCDSHEADQPFFYVDADLDIAAITELVPLLRSAYTRQRFS